MGLKSLSRFNTRGVVPQSKPDKALADRIDPEQVIDDFENFLDIKRFGDERIDPA